MWICLSQVHLCNSSHASTELLLAPTEIVAEKFNTCELVKPGAATLTVQTVL